MQSNGTPPRTLWQPSSPGQLGHDRHGRGDRIRDRGSRRRQGARHCRACTLAAAETDVGRHLGRDVGELLAVGGVDGDAGAGLVADGDVEVAFDVADQAVGTVLRGVVHQHLAELSLTVLAAAR